MHELLLHASIPSFRHNQILSILAGLTATPNPTRINEIHHVLRPALTARTQQSNSLQLGASQDVDSGKIAKRAREDAAAWGFGRSWCDLVLDVEAEERGRTREKKRRKVEDDAGSAMDQEEVDQLLERKKDEEVTVTPWSLFAAETPEPGVRSVVSRRVALRNVMENELDGFEKRNDLVLTMRYVVEGHQFVRGNATLRLQRYLRMDLPSGEAPVVGVDVKGAKTRLFDESGAYVLEASVRLEDNPGAALLGRGTEELRRLKDDLDGCIELRNLDRLAFDTRVR